MTHKKIVSRLSITAIANSSTNIDLEWPWKVISAT